MEEDACGGGADGGAEGSSVSVGEILDSVFSALTANVSMVWRPSYAIEGLALTSRRYAVPRSSNITSQPKTWKHSFSHEPHEL